MAHGDAHAVKECKLANATRSSLCFQRWLLNGTTNATQAPLPSMQPSPTRKFGGVPAVVATSKPQSTAAPGAGHPDSSLVR